MGGQKLQSGQEIHASCEYHQVGWIQDGRKRKGGNPTYAGIYTIIFRSF